MTTITDERRARAMCRASGIRAFANTITPQQHQAMEDRDWHLWLDDARAIRASDEAAGMVLVPRDATIEMIVAGTETWLCKAAMEDRAEACWGAMIAATEAQE